MRLVSKATNSKFLFIGIGLGTGDEPFTAESGELFKSVLTSLGMNPSLIELRKDDFEDETIPEHLITEINEFISSQGIDKVVILGKNAASQLAPSLLKGTSFSKLNTMSFLTSKEFGPNVKVAVAYHPKFILNSIEDNSNNVLAQYKTRIQSIVSNTKSQYDVHINRITFSELVELLPSIANEDYISIDFESNGLDPWHKDFRITLFSVSVHPGAEKDIYSWYIPAHTITNQSDVDKFRDFIEATQHKLWAFNCSYEIKVLWRWLGKFFKIQDALVLITMNSSRSNLKTAVRRFIGADFWESDVAAFLETYKYAFKALSNQKFDNLRNFIDSDGNKIDNLTRWLEVATEVKFDKKSIQELTELAAEFSEEDVFNGLRNYPHEWAAVPEEILGAYCCYDSAYTIPLARMFSKKFEAGYPVYICHPWLAAVFESNGIAWNDKRAQLESDEYVRDMVQCLFDVIQDMDSLPEQDRLDARNVMSWTLPHTFTYYTPGGSERKHTVKTEIDRLNELKMIFNPGSNTKENRAKFWDAYLTQEIELATIMYGLINELRFRGVWTEILGKISAGFTTKEDNFETAFIKHCGVEKLTDLIVSLTNGDSHLGNVINDALVETTNTYKENFTGKFAKEIMSAQHEIHTLFFKVDIDKPETWSKQYRMLFNLQKYKKIAKSLSTNINGGTGRGNVAAVDKVDGLLPAIRTKNYYDMTDEERADQSKWVLNTDFNTLSAVTHRWTSGFHIIPAGSSVRECLVPHWDDGIWVHADFSQAELVILAFFSGDPEMLKVFLSGGDMHRYVASVVFEKPIDQVTSEERRGAKAVSFGIIYGKSVENTAIEINAGDVPKTQRLFDSFFVKFPGIKVWMNQRYKEVDELGKVTNLFGAFIDIDTTAPGGAKYRQACNYPIQSTSSMLAGTAMWQFQEYCWDHGIPHRGYGFTHDAMDSETRINYVFQYLKALRKVLQDDIYSTIGAPMRIDYEIGVNAYQLCSLSDVEHTDSTITFVLEGIEKDVNDLLNMIKEKSKWAVSKVDLIKSKKVFTSYGDMFSLKAAYKTTWGTEQVKATYKVELVEK